MGWYFELKEPTLEFRGMIEKEADPSNTLGDKWAGQEQRRKLPSQLLGGATGQKWILTADHGLTHRTLLQFGQSLINKVPFLISFSTSWTRMSYKPYCRAKERHRVPRFSVNCGGAIINSPGVVSDAETEVSDGESCRDKVSR